MSGPYGPPAGYGPGGQQGWAPAPARPPMGIGKIAAAATAGLGFISLIMGFLPAATREYPAGLAEDESTSVFQSGAVGLVAVLFAAGLIALGAFLPKGGTSPIAVFGLSVGGGLGVVFTVIMMDTEDVPVQTGMGQAVIEQGRGAGAIILMIIGLLQAVAATMYWLFDSGTVTPRRSAPAYGYGQGGPAGPGGAPGFGGPGSPAGPPPGYPTPPPGYSGGRSDGPPSPGA